MKDMIMQSQRFIRFGIILNIALIMTHLIMWFQAWQTDQLWRADFTNFYTAWVMVQNGQGDQLYDLEIQTQVQQAILQHGRSFTDGVLPYSNPPYAVFPFLPLAWLPHEVAYWIWILINLGMLAWILRYILKTVAASWSNQERWAIIIIGLAFPPLFIALMLGTFSLLVTTSLICAFIAFKRGKDIQGAVWLFVACIKFPLVLLPILTLLGARRWKAIATGLGLGVLAGLVTGLAFGFDIWGEYLAFLNFHNNSYGRFGIDPRGMYNFKGLLTNLLGMDNIGIIATLSAWMLVIGSIIAIIFQFRRWNPENPPWKLRFGFIVALGIFLSLHLYTHDLLLMLVSGLLGYIALREQGDSKKLHYFGAFMLLLPVLFLVSDGIPLTILPIRGPIILQFILLGWLGWLLSRNNPNNAPQ